MHKTIVKRKPACRRMANPAFRRWFKDSKVKDEAGVPLVVYHGTPNSFSKFDTFPAFFTTDAQAALAYAENQYARDDDDSGPHIMPVYLALKNPKVLTEDQLGELIGMADGRVDWGDFDYLAYNLEKEGFDGVVIQDVLDFAGVLESNGTTQYSRYDQYVAFNSAQIKSAIGNNRSYDTDTPDITR